MKSHLLNDFEKFMIYSTVIPYTPVIEEVTRGTNLKTISPTAWCTPHTFQRTKWRVPYPHYTWRCPHSVGCLLSYPGSSSAPAPAPRYARSSSRTRLVRAGSNRLKAITAIWPSGSFFGWRRSRTAEAAPAIPVDKLTKFVKKVN